MTVELALSQITEALRRFGEDVHEGQPEQVAGRWVGNGFEDPDEVAAWLEAGIVDPEEARTRVEQGERPVRSPGRHRDEAAHGRDIERGTTKSRSRPGDAFEREPQGPGSPP